MFTIDSAPGMERIESYHSVFRLTAVGILFLRGDGDVN